VRPFVLLAAGLLLAYAGIAPVMAAGEQANLSIVQPDYVDGSVTTDTADDEIIYGVKGPRQLITFESAPNATVSDFGIAEGSGSLDYQASTDLYIFIPDGNGSTTLFWVANGTRYEAVIQTESVDWVHRSSTADQSLNEQAEKYQQIESEVEQMAPDSETDDVISSALTYWKFFDSPFSSLIQDMRGTLAIMFLRPGGLIITGFFLAIALLGVASGARYRNRTQKQLADIGDIEIEKSEAYLKKAKRILSNTDYNEFLPDDAARAMRETLGRNPWIGFKNYLLLRSPVHVKGVVLQMMGAVGYQGRYRRGYDGQITEAWVERDDVSTDGDGVERMDLSALDYDNIDHRDYVQAVPSDQLDYSVFQEDIGPDDVSFPISNRQVDDAELLEELNPHFPDDFEDEEHLARALGSMVEFVCDHDHTDAWGLPHRELDLLSFLAEMDSVLADEADFPVGHVHRRMLVYIADNMEREDEVTETVERLEEDGV